LNGLNDIEVNFVISSLGVFEGRGWNSQPEKPWNGSDLIIGFFTDFLYRPGETSRKLLDALIDDGKFLGKISEDFELVCFDNFCSIPEDLTVNRREWQAEPSKEVIKALVQPITRVIVTDTTDVGLESCETKVWKTLQKILLLFSSLNLGNLYASDSRTSSFSFCQRTV
jgi:hypothetical protein